MMLDHIVLDIETQRLSTELPNGWSDTDLMGLAVGVLYEYRTDRYMVYGPEDLEALKDRLQNADRITTFNGWRFDLPVLWEQHDGEPVNELRGKSNDLLARIWHSLGLDPANFSDAHKGWSLGIVAQGTLGVGKSDSGLNAPAMFKAGQWARLTSYCLDDVRLTRDLDAFIERYGYVVNGKTRAVVEILV